MTELQLRGVLVSKAAGIDYELQQQRQFVAMSARDSISFLDHEVKNWPHLYHKSNRSNFLAAWAFFIENSNGDSNKSNIFSGIDYHS